MKHHSLSRTRVALAIGALLLAGCNDNDSTPKPEQPVLPGIWWAGSPWPRRQG